MPGNTVVKLEPIQAAKWSHRIIFGRVQDECFDEFDDELFDEFDDEFVDELFDEFVWWVVWWLFGKSIDEFVENLGDFWCFVSDFLWLNDFDDFWMKNSKSRI